MTNTTLTVAVAKTIRSESWRNVTGTWGQFVKSFKKFRTGPKDGPCFCPFSLSGPNRRKEALLKSRLLVLDVDTPTAPDFSVLHGDEAIVHSTHSGCWRVIILLSRDVTPQEYTTLATKLAKALQWSKLDPVGMRPVQGYYYPTIGPSKVQFFQHFEGSPLDVSAVLAPSGASTVPAQADMAPATLGLDLLALRAKAKGNTAVQRFLEQRLALKEGERDNTVTAIMGWMARAPVPVAEWPLVAPLVESMVAQSECPEGPAFWMQCAREKFERFLATRKHDDAQVAAMRSAFKLDAPEDADESWKERLIRQSSKDGSTKLDPCVTNAVLILENDPLFKTLRFNSMTLKPECEEGPLKDKNIDVMPTALHMFLHSSEYRMKLSRNDCGAAIAMLLHNKTYDPLKNYFDSLPEWDGVDRLTTLMHDHMGVLPTQNKTYVRAVSRMFFIGAAARALKPGCQLDSMLLLSGPAGIHKSTFVQTIAGGFAGVGKLDGDKDSLMLVARKWILEFAEMATSGGYNSEAVCSFITTRQDDFRLPYGKSIETFQRHCAFVGTTNKTAGIQAEEGLRRYWPIEVTNIDIPWIEANLLQIWAEAKAAFLAGEKWHFEGQAARDALAEAELHQSAPLYQEQLEDLFDRMKPEKRKQYYQMMEIARLLCIDSQAFDQGTRTKVGTALSKLGFTPSYIGVGANRKRVYNPPLKYRAEAEQMAEEGVES